MSNGNTTYADSVRQIRPCCDDSGDGGAFLNKSRRSRPRTWAANARTSMHYLSGFAARLVFPTESLNKTNAIAPIHPGSIRKFVGDARRQIFPQCQPSLPDSELRSNWHSARRLCAARRPLRTRRLRMMLAGKEAALRDLRIYPRDFCAAFRENDVASWGRKLARQAFATNEINCLETSNRATNQGVVGSIPAGRATYSTACSDASHVSLAAVGENVATFPSCTSREPDKQLCAARRRRRTSSFGAAAGAMPPVLGWTAVGNHVLTRHCYW